MTSHPYMDEGLRRWILTTANRNYWRVQSWYSKEDLIQDGYLCYFKCVEHYQRLNRKRKPKKDDRRNFMALVKRAFENHIHTLATKRTETPERAISQVHRLDETAEMWLERRGPVESSLADVMAIVDDIPTDIKKILALIATDAVNDVAYFKIKLRNYHKRETTNERLCRLAGVNLKKLQRLTQIDLKSVDIVDALRQYFQSQIAR